MVVPKCGNILEPVSKIRRDKNTTSDRNTTPLFGIRKDTDKKLFNKVAKWLSMVANCKLNVSVVYKVTIA